MEFIDAKKHATKLAKIIFQKKDDLNELLSKYESTKTIQVSNEYSSPKTQVGSILRSESLLDLSHFLLHYRENILYGGNINFATKVVEPCIININFSDNIKFQEVYAPIFYTVTYKTDDDLKKYLNHTNYLPQNMYVSLFGKNNFLTHNPNIQLLHNQVVMDIDNGNAEFGGYGMHTSFVQNYGYRFVKPVLIPREIKIFLDEGLIRNNLPLIRQGDNTIVPMKELVANIFRKRIQDIFGENLLLGFIFGSFAKNRDKLTSDLDMFVCLKKRDRKQEALFKDFYFSLHYKFGRKPDVFYPGEIMMLDELKDKILLLQNIELSGLKNCSSELFDALVWSHALCYDKKLGKIGNNKFADFVSIKAKDALETFASKVFNLCLKNTASEEEKKDLIDIMVKKDYLKLFNTLSYNECVTKSPIAIKWKKKLHIRDFSIQKSVEKDL